MAELGGKEKKVESAAQVPRRPKRMLLWSLVLLCAVLAGLGVLYAYLKTTATNDAQRSAITVGTGEQVSGRVEVLSADHQKQLANTNVDARTDVDRAYAKAVALSARDEHAAALKIYEQIVAGGKAPYYIYIDYALTTSRAGDNARAAELMKTALQKLESDSSLSAELKASKKKALEGKLAGFEESTP